MLTQQNHNVVYSMENFKLSKLKKQQNRMAKR